MSYQQIKDNEETIAVTKHCEVLEVSRSGYYDWRDRPVCQRKQVDLKLGVKIKSSFEESDQTYGSPRVLEDLKAEGIAVGRKRVARLMRENQLISVHKKKFCRTTDSSHKLPVAENILQRDFNESEINKKWVGDITYIPTRQGWLYLAVVIDLCSRRVIGWSFNDNLNKEIAVDAFKMAIELRQTSAELFHSDQGVQYASGMFQSSLEQSGTISSMSRKGNCWDNSVAESFFHSLKVERVSRKSYVSKDQARIDIFDYIERFYNRKRRHSTIGYVSPVNFEESKLAA